MSTGKLEALKSTEASQRANDEIPASSEEEVKVEVEQEEEVS